MILLSLHLRLVLKCKLHSCLNQNVLVSCLPQSKGLKFKKDHYLWSSVMENIPIGGASFLFITELRSDGAEESLSLVFGREDANCLFTTE